MRKYGWVRGEGVLVSGWELNKWWVGGLERVWDGFWWMRFEWVLMDGSGVGRRYVSECVNE